MVTSINNNIRGDILVLGNVSDLVFKKVLVSLSIAFRDTINSSYNLEATISHHQLNSFTNLSSFITKQSDGTSVGIGSRWAASSTAASICTLSTRY